LSEQNSHRGQVIRSTGKEYILYTPDKQTFQAKLKGNWRTRGIRTTNPLAVGDWVKYTLDASGNAIIHTLEPRKNTIVRKSIKLSKAAHIIASNVDQAIIVATAKKPFTSYPFIDRFLVGIESYHVPAILVLNKTDLHDGKERLDEMEKIYSNAGYPVIKTSKQDSNSIQKLRLALKDKVTLMAGHSGVGKSTLINLIDSKLNLKTAIISEAYDLGKHTTTHASMFALEMGGCIIDTPGIKGFGLHNIEKNELATYFPEWQECIDDCKFYNCTHINEPGCAIRAALDRGKLNRSRYESYLNMFLEDEKSIYR
jgi:ribosome biogenesis GTPase